MLLYMITAKSKKFLTSRNIHVKKNSFRNGLDIVMGGWESPWIIILRVDVQEPSSILFLVCLIPRDIHSFNKLTDIFALLLALWKMILFLYPLNISNSILLY